MSVSRWFARAALVVCAAVTLASPASAQFTYVGTWNTSDGPNWYQNNPTGTLAYTGREAAALLFGGAASDYVVSTAGSNVSDINNSAWYSVIGAGAWEFSDTYFNKYLGQYYGPTDTYACCGGAYQYSNAASAYIADNGGGANFAFRVDATPEPATLALVLPGLIAVGAAVRRRKS